LIGYGSNRIKMEDILLQTHLNKVGQIMFRVLGKQRKAAKQKRLETKEYFELYDLAKREGDRTLVVQ